MKDLINHRFEQGIKTMARKETEYAHGNRFSNFFNAASILKCSPEKALVGMMVKHTVSIKDIMEKKIPWCNTHVTKEKFGDQFNYFILLLAMVTKNQDIKSLLDIDYKETITTFMKGEPNIEDLGNLIGYLADRLESAPWETGDIIGLITKGIAISLQFEAKVLGIK